MTAFKFDIHMFNHTSHTDAYIQQLKFDLLLNKHNSVQSLYLNKNIRFAQTRKSAIKKNYKNAI